MERIVQFQRFLGRLEGEAQSFNGSEFPNPVPHEGLAIDVLKASDFFDASNTIVFGGSVVNGQYIFGGFRSEGLSLMRGLIEAVASVEQSNRNTLDLYEAIGFLPEDNPENSLWNFSNFQTTNTLQDYVGAALYEPAVADIEAAFAAANNLSGELNSTLGNTFTVGEVT